VTIPAGKSIGYFWYKSSANFNLNSPVSISPISLGAATSGTLAYTSVMSSAEFDVADCIPLEIKLSAGATNNTSQSLSASVSVTPMTNNFGTFYSDPSCSTPLTDNRITFSAGEIGVKTVFYNRKVIIQPNHVAPILGYVSESPFGTGGLTTYTSYTTTRDGTGVLSIGAGLYSNGVPRYIAKIGDQTIGGYNYPQAIAYGAVTGLGLSGVIIANLSNTNLNLGKPIQYYSVRAVAGPNADNFNAGYGGDDAPAIGALFNDVMGVTPIESEAKLLVADRGNNRGRFVEIDSSNVYARAFLGVGRLRERQSALQIESNQAALARPHKLEYFDNNLYVSEANNNRIRRVNLTTGIISVVAGAGWGTSFNEGNDAVNEFMRTPLGFKVIAWPNSLSPTNYILVYAENCQIRAVNLSGPTITSFMGVSNILPGKVKTIAGDTTVACQGTTQWGSWNTNGMNATSARFRSIQDVAFIKNEIYFLDLNDNCLMRINSSGELYEVGSGTCGVNSTSSEGEFNTTGFKVLRPFAFAPDMAFPMNYFLIDNYYSSVSNISYINTQSVDRSFVNGTKIAYGTNNIARSSYIYNPQVTTVQARPRGVASWSQTPGTVTNQDIVCWGSGDVDTNISNPIQGSHTITCAHRSLADTGSVVAGPLSNDGAGGPLGFEQEGVSRFSMTFWGPTGLAFDEEGNLYIADSGNHIIRMIRRWW
jgi:hypothetical protein